MCERAPTSGENVPVRPRNTRVSRRNTRASRQNTHVSRQNRGVSRRTHVCRPRRSVPPTATHMRRARDTGVSRENTGASRRNRVCHGRNTPARRQRRCGVGRATHRRQAPTQWVAAETEVRRAHDAVYPRESTGAAHPRHTRVALGIHADLAGRGRAIGARVRRHRRAPTMLLPGTAASLLPASPPSRDTR
jgi:hypothetical protein